MEQGSIQELPIYEPELNNNYEGSIIRNEKTNTNKKKKKKKKNNKDERVSEIIQGSIQEFPIYEPELNNTYEESGVREEKSTTEQEDKIEENSKDERASQIRRAKALMLLGLTIFFGEKAFNFFSRNKNIRIDNAIGIVGVADFGDKDFGDKFYDGYLFDLKSAIENNYINVKLLENPYIRSDSRPYYRNATYDDVVYLHEKYGDDFVNKVVIERDNTVFHISGFKFVDGRFSVNVGLGLTNDTLKIVEKEIDKIDRTNSCDLEFAMDFGIVKKVIDEDSEKELTYNDVLDIARTDRTAKQLRSIRILCDAEYNSDEAILNYDYNTDKVCVLFNYKKILAKVVSGKYFNVKDAFEQIDYPMFEVYNLEDVVRVFNYSDFQALYEKYGDNVANEVQLTFIIDTGVDEYGTIDLDYVPFEITGIKETEDGFMISVEKDFVTCAKKYAEHGLPFDISDGIRAGVITVAHKEEGFLTADEFERMIRDAYKIDIANRNSDCSGQFLANIDVFDGNAEKLIEGKIRDWDGLPDFEPNAPIINENINHEKLH